MLDIVVKHYVYDRCIDIVFNGIYRNFARVDENYIPSKGEFVSKISNRYEDEHYFNCRIINVIPKVFSDGNSYNIILFTYTSSTGTYINEFDEYINELDADELTTDEYDELIASGEYDEDDFVDFDDDVDMIDLDEDFDGDFVQLVEYEDDMIAINSSYYIFYK